MDILAYAIITLIGLIILGLAAWSRLSLARTTARLMDEEGFLAQARTALAGVTPEEASAHPDVSEWLIGIAGLSDSSGRNSVVSGRILRMAKLARTQLAGDQLLADILVRSEDLRPQHPRFIGSIMVFIALTGTVASLGFAISAVPRFGDQSANLSPLNNVIGHMLPAFVITALGIFATVVVSYWNHMFDHRLDSFVLDVEEFSVDVLAPLLLCHPYMADLSRVEALQHELVKTTKGLRDVVTDVGDSLKESIGSMRQAADEHSEAIHGALIQGATQFVNDAGEAGRELSAAAGTIGKSAETAVGSIEKALSAASAMTTTAAQIGESLDKSSSTLESTLTRLSDTVGVFPSYLGSLEEAIARLGLGVESFSNNQLAISNNLAAALGQWKSAAQGLDTLAETLRGIYGEVKNALDAMAHGADMDRKIFIEEMGKLSDNAAARVTELAEIQRQMKGDILLGFEAAAEKHQAGIREVVEQARAEMSNLGKLVSKLSDDIDGTLAYVSATADAVKTIMDQMPVSALDETVTKLPERVALAVRSSAGELRRVMRESQTADGSYGSADGREVVQAISATNELLSQLLAVQPKRRSRTTDQSRPPKGRSDGYLKTLVGRLTFWRK